MIKRLTAIRDNYLIEKTSGDYELHIFMMLRDIDQLMAARDEVASINGITRLEMMLMPILVPFPFPREYISTF